MLKRFQTPLIWLMVVALCGVIAISANAQTMVGTVVNDGTDVGNVQYVPTQDVRGGVDHYVPEKYVPAYGQHQGHDHSYGHYNDYGHSYESPTYHHGYNSYEPPSYVSHDYGYQSDCGCGEVVTPVEPAQPCPAPILEPVECNADPSPAPLPQPVECVEYSPACNQCRPVLSRCRAFVGRFRRCR